MLLSIAADDDPLATASLYTWLRKSPLEGVQGEPLLVRRSGETTTMGAADVVNIVVSNAIGLGSLLVAFGSWRQSKRRAPAVTFRLGDVEVRLDDDDPETMKTVLRVLKARFASDDDAAGP